MKSWTRATSRYTMYHYFQQLGVLNIDFQPPPPPAPVLPLRVVVEFNCSSMLPLLTLPSPLPPSRYHFHPYPHSWLRPSFLLSSSGARRIAPGRAPSPPLVANAQGAARRYINLIAGGVCPRGPAEDDNVGAAPPVSANAANGANAHRARPLTTRTSPKPNYHACPPCAHTPSSSCVLHSLHDHAQHLRGPSEPTHRHPFHFATFPRAPFQLPVPPGDAQLHHCRANAPFTCYAAAIFIQQGSLVFDRPPAARA